MDAALGARVGALTPAQGDPDYPFQPGSADGEPELSRRGDEAYSRSPTASSASARFGQVYADWPSSLSVANRAPGGP